MPVQAVCPDCEAAYTLADTQRGKKVRCRECETLFVVPMAAHKGGSRRDDDEDEVEDDRPKKKKKKQKEQESSGAALLVVGIAVGLVVLLGAGLGVAFMMRGGDTKKEPVASTTPSPAPPLPKEEPKDQVKDQPKDQLMDQVKDQAKDKGPETTPVTVTPNASAGQNVYRYLLKSTAWVFIPLTSTMARTGTGSLIDKTNRLVLTNYHVVMGSPPAYFVLFPTYQQDKLVAAKKEYMDMQKREMVSKGTVVMVDKRRDLALIQLDKIPDNVSRCPSRRAAWAPARGSTRSATPGPATGCGSTPPARSARSTTSSGGPRPVRRSSTWRPTSSRPSRRPTPATAAGPWSATPASWSASPRAARPPAAC